METGLGVWAFQKRPTGCFLTHSGTANLCDLPFEPGNMDTTRFGQAHRYHRPVFLAPPWTEMYVTDSERRHGLDAAVAEYHRLLDAYPSLGYEVVILPKVGVQERADFVLKTLAS
jgi:predicted ATPase